MISLHPYKRIKLVIYLHRCKNYEREEIVENKISKFFFFPRNDYIIREYIKEYINTPRMINRQ